MASKYSQKFPIPQGFPEILHDFTREVLRDQPDDLEEYAAQYFECLHLKKPFHFDSKYNVKADNPKTHYAPHQKKEFDPEKPPQKERPVPAAKREETEGSHNTTHKEEKSAAHEYVSGMNEKVLDKVVSGERSEISETGQEEEAKEEGSAQPFFRYYFSAASPVCFPVTYLLKKFEIPCELVQVDPKDEADRPIPALEEGEQEVVGLISCLLYICRKFEIDDTLCPNIMTEDSEIEQFFKNFLEFESAFEQIGKAVEQQGDIAQEEGERLEAFLQEIDENVLPNHPFLVNEENITLADLVVIGYLSSLFTTNYDFKKFPHVENWVRNALGSEIRDDFIEFFNNYRQAYQLEGQNEILTEL